MQLIYLILLLDLWKPSSDERLLNGFEIQSLFQKLNIFLAVTPSHLNLSTCHVRFMLLATDNF